MKHSIYILVVLIFTGCSSTKKLTENHSNPTRFVFKKSMVASQSGISNLESKTDSLIDATYNPNGKDSWINKRLKGIRMTDFLTQTPDTEIYLEVINDTIWRHTKQNGKMIGDYFMIKRSNGILYYYDKSKSVNYRKYDLFAINDEYEISENKEDRKEIKGYDCFKLTLMIKDPESDLGDSIYEMYVTDRIDLPAHSVINLTKEISNIFPMEIKILGENLPGMAELYELIEIK